MKYLEAKVITLGLWGVGKTCIVKRYVDKAFEPGYKQTIGACFFWTKIDVDDIKLTLQIWDTAGQERFKSVMPMYHRAANAVLLIFDITKYNSFAYTKSVLLEFRKHSDENIALLLVGNKIDLNQKREVFEEEAKEYAISIGASYHEVSALQDYGIDDIFHAVANGLINLANSGIKTKLKFYECPKDVNISRKQVLKMLENSTMNCKEIRKKRCSCK